MMLHARFARIQFDKRTGGPTKRQVMSVTLPAMLFSKDWNLLLAEGADAKDHDLWFQFWTKEFSS